MKRKLLLCILGLIGFAGLILSSCLQSRPGINQVNPAFGQYISGYTSGMVSRKTSIRIELADNYYKSHPVSNVPAFQDSAAAAIYVAAQLAALPDSSLLKDIFSFEPEIKGKTVWVSDRVIEFIPEEALPPNTLYGVRFRLSKVQDVPKEFRNFRFQFSTYPQNLFVEVEGLRSYDDYNIEWQKVTGKLTISDYEDTSFVRKCISVTQNGKALPLSLSPSYYNNNELYFYADSVRRYEKSGKVLVTWNATPMRGLQRGTEEVIVPGLGDFYVSSAKVVDQEDQHIELIFSDPLKHDQNLKGIVSVQGVSDLSYDIDGNVVRAYLPGRIVGQKVVEVTTGIKNFKGYKMNAPYSTSLIFNEPKPMVRIKGSGNILPNSNGLILPFEAISLNSVDVRVVRIFGNNVHQFLQVNDLDGQNSLTRVGKVIAEKKIRLDYNKKTDLKQWNQHIIDLGKLVEPEPGAIYRVSIKFGRKDAICDCSGVEDESEEEDNSLREEDKDPDWSENDWNSYGFDGGYDSWYGYYDSYTACNSYYYNGKAVSRNILASDIGLIYKMDDSKLSHAFVTNMITAKPLANAQIEYYDYAKQLIASGTSDANGMLDLQLRRKPFLMVAKYGSQRGYLKLLDGNANSLSKFDVSGEVVQKGVKGFIYGERGVWRPGDSLFLTFIMEDKGKRLPADHPVKFELQDPNGQVVYQATKTRNVNGMYDFRTATGDEAITGNYTAIAHVGNRIFTQSLKVETVKPNRLKIYMDFGNGKRSDSVARLSVKWLHGAIAKNLHATVNVSVNQMPTTFDGYRSYVFDSPIRSFYSDAEAIFDGNLDDKGEVPVKTALSVGQTAPGMLRATYITKVFEEGGDFSIDRYSKPYSPYRTYIGLQAPKQENYDHTYETGKTYRFDIASLSAEGKPVDAKNLQVKVYKIQWRWWYEREDENLATYVSRAGTIVVKDTLVKTSGGKGYFPMRINYPEYGRYLITVSDLEGGHETGQVVYIDWPYWSRANRSNSENANMLSFSCDKEKYTTGENIKLSFPSPSDGMALVSVESGTRVIKKFWISTKKGETTHEFAATADMSPNAYVHVTLLQPHASTRNDLPIRMYGVVPVMVDEPSTHLLPAIEMADVIKPESTASIRVSEKHGKKMTYTLAMVDEGLLDLTRFKTPQPWTTFYAREALSVKTWDMYDAVIGAFAGRIDKLLSVGGDGDGIGAKGVKANRFKPMVKFMGPFQLEAGGARTHRVQIPNYVGSVRVMIVAQQDGAYGNAEKAVAVRKPLMILATLPRVLGPGESVSLPVNVFAMEKQVKDVKVEIELNELLNADGNKQQSMRFEQTGDEVINFKLKVAEKTGIAKVKIIATSGRERAVQEIELDVRTPNPKVSDGFDMTLEPGKSWQQAITFKGISGTNKATIEFSSIPSIGLEKRLDYLIQYPHGCIEQTTSGVFPQLYVMNLTELKETQKQKISQNVKAALKRLQLFQTSNGGFAYWPGEFYESEWGSNYAGHFMIEAEGLGYALPANLKSKWLKYQQDMARNWSNSGSRPACGEESHQAIQAYRLFVLALSKNAELGAMNRLREEKKLSATARWRLAAAYQLVGQHEVAEALVKDLATSVPKYKELSYSYGSDVRDKAMILETLSLLKDKGRATPLAREVARQLNSNDWMSTQETAYSLLAICEFADAKGGNKEMSFGYALNGGAERSGSTKKSLYQASFTEKDLTGKGSLLLRNTGDVTLFAKVIVEGIPLVGDKTASAKDLKMEVVYKNMKGQIIQPDKLVQGTDFMAVVTISNPGSRGNLQEMALSQIFPSGWEIHNSRMDETGTASAARYQDIRDDRVYSYYELKENSSKTFVIQLNATYLGRFYLPTVYSEAMYDHLIHARVPGRWVEVVKEAGAVATK